MNKPKTYSPEVRERTVPTVFDHAHEYPSQWAAIQSITDKIGCSAETLCARPSEIRAGGLGSPPMNTHG